MSKDQEREAFEHYFSDGGKSPRSVERGADGKYLLGSAHNAWRVWQASRAAMAPAGEPVARSARRVSVDSGALAMVLNALRRDAAEGKASRQEMVDELEATISPAPDRAEVLRLAREMNRRFTSMNSVPIDKATVPTAEWAELRAALIKLLGTTP